MECHVLWTAVGAICERILGSKWRLPKSWGYPKSSKITQFSDWNNHGDLGIPHFENPKFFPNIAAQMIPQRSQLGSPKFPVLGPFIRVWPKRIPKQFLLWNIGAFCPADVGLQGANVCQDPMGGLQPDPLRPPVQAWWNQPKITWMEGVYQEFVFHTIWIPLNCIFLTAQLGSLGTLGSISSIPTSTRDWIPSQHNTRQGKTGQWCLDTSREVFHVWAPQRLNSCFRARRQCRRVFYNEVSNRTDTRNHTQHFLVIINCPIHLFPQKSTLDSNLDG